MLLNIQRVRFRNFYSFGAKWQEIVLDEGINLVVGFDKDSGRRNGAGKSCLIDSVVFGLFGKTSKDVTLPRIVNWKNRKQCEVHIDFLIGENQYRIERGIKPNYLKLFKDDVEQDQTGKTEFQADIERDILGIDYDTFMALIYCNPNTQVSIFSTSKPKKRALLETLFGLGDFSAVSKGANEKIAVLNKKIQDIEFDTEQNSRTKATLRAQIETLESKKQELPDGDELARILSDLEYNRILLKEAGEFNYSLEHITKVKTKLSGSIRNLYRKIDGDRTLQANKTIRELQDDRSKCQTRLKRASDDKVVLDGRIVVLKSTLAGIMGERRAFPDITKLKDGCVCPTCLSKVSVKKAQKELELMDKTLTDRQNDIQGRIDEVLISLAEIEEIKKQIQSDIIYADEMIKTQHNFLYGRALVAQERYLENLEETEKNAKNKTELEGKILSLESRLEVLLERKESVQRENGVIIEQQRENYKTIADLDEADEASTKDRKKFLGMRDYVEYVKFLCKDENVKQYAISNIIPYINQQANEYLSQTGFNFYLKLDSFLDVEIKGPGIQDASYGNMSGGEAKTINLAVQLALMDVCRMKSPIFPNVLLLDELLDGAVDGPGLAAMVEIIKYKQAQNDLKVFIISHRKEINEFESNKIYQVTKTKGFSTVEEIQ